MLLCVLGSLPKALHDAALRKVMTSAAVDIKTGEVYLDESGFIPENLNKLM